MTLAKYIEDLLYRYDCVIVPTFGGFVTNKIGARRDESQHILYPPTKQITFNSILKNNDGLLANYIASVEKISFDEAVQKIKVELAEWREELEKNTITIASIGTLQLNEENQLLFEPNTSNNYLTDSFGLSTVNSSLIERYKEEAKTLLQPQEELVNVVEEKSVAEVINIKEQERKPIPMFIKYAASAAILLTLGGIGWKTYKTDQQENIVASKEEAVEQKIQQATFIIDNPLPTIDLKINKTSRENYPYHIVAGAFQSVENAEKKVNQLKEKGFNSEIIGKNKWGLTQVTYDSFMDESEARKALIDIKKQESKEAWLLIQR